MPRGDTESENQEGAISFETLRDEGQHFVHVQQFDKAIESFTKVYVKTSWVGWHTDVCYQQHLAPPSDFDSSFH